jgi:hypothetical protein
MPDLRRKNCQRCLKPSTEVGPISWRGNCRACGFTAANAMYDDLTSHDGPGFDHWRLQLARSVGYGPLDDLAARH